MPNYRPLTTGHSRVFITKGGACPTHKPLYHSCLVAGKVVKPHGDVESLEVPRPTRYGQWDVADTVHTGKTAGACSVDLAGWYAMDLASELLAIGRNQRQYSYGTDVQLHMGECRDASQFYPYEKVLILANAFIGSYNIDMPKSPPSVAVGENVTIMGTDLYEVLPMSAGIVVTTSGSPALLDVTVGQDCCGDCTIYGITDLPSCIIFYSEAHGWGVDAISTLVTKSAAPVCFGILSGWIVVFSNVTDSFHYAAEVDLWDGTAIWTESDAGIASPPNCCCAVGTMIWVGCEDGYILKLDNPHDAAITLENGTLTDRDILCIHGLDENKALAGGQLGVVLYTVNQGQWHKANSPNNWAADINAVWMMDDKTWLVGDADSKLWYTTDRGDTWTLKKAFD